MVGGVKVSRHLRLVAGALFPADANEARPAQDFRVRAPILEKFITRADRLAQAPTDMISRIAAEFQVAPSPGGAYPVAPYTRLADGGEPDNAFWLRADPVHLVPHIRGMQLVNAEHIGLTAEEGAQLARELGEVFVARNCRLEPRTDKRWYLRAPRPLAVNTTPLSDSEVRELREHMPGGPDGAWLRALLTEVQLVLHASPVNAERLARRKPPVNSLWFWGGGALADVAHGAPDCVWSDDPFATGLAMAGRIARQPLPANARQWLAASSPGTHLVVFGTTASQAQIESLENLWFAPLIAAMRAGELESLTIAAENAPHLRGTRATMRRWWRGSRAFV